MTTNTNSTKFWIITFIDGHQINYKLYCGSLYQMIDYKDHLTNTNHVTYFEELTPESFKDKFYNLADLVQL